MKDGKAAKLRPKTTPCFWRTEKPQNCTPKMPNVTSETHRKCYFWFLFLLAAAMNFGYLFLLLLQRLLLLLLLVPGWENTMAVKDGEAPKLHQVTSEITAEAFATAAAGPRIEKHYGKKLPPDREIPMPNVTSETHRKWWFWHLFPLAAAMNFGYLFLLLLQKLLLLLLLVPGWENTMAVKDGKASKLRPKTP